jgi:hypothetical protein
MSVRIQLGSFGAWFNPTLDDDSRVRFAAEAEALGYGTAWLGLGRRVEPDLALVERVLDATRSIVVATATRSPIRVGWRTGSAG